MSGAGFIAGDAATKIGIPVATLRDWRRRGFLDGIGVLLGTKQNSAWSYSQVECDMLAAAYQKSKLPRATIGDFIAEEMRALK